MFGGGDLAVLLLGLAIGGFVVIYPAIVHYVILGEICWISLYTYGTWVGISTDALDLFI